ncbi:MAG: DNA repair protein RecO [Caulobacterales bacterium]
MSARVSTRWASISTTKMEWTDAAIVLGSRHFGEGKLLAEVFSRVNGRFGGVVHAGRKSAPVLQAGNLIHTGWKARLSEQLGFFNPLDLDTPYAGRVLEDPVALAGIGSAIALVRGTTAERQAYPGVFDALIVLLEALPQDEVWPAIYARFEIGLLAQVGYGLDLQRCAVTGTTEELAYVSPRTGRAASAEAGAPFADKLLRLPGFLIGRAEIEEGDVADALALAGYFLERRVYDQRGEGMPEARRRLIERLGFAGRL